MAAGQAAKGLRGKVEGIFRGDGGHRGDCLAVLIYCLPDLIHYSSTIWFFGCWVGIICACKTNSLLGLGLRQPFALAFHKVFCILHHGNNQYCKHQWVRRAKESSPLQHEQGLPQICSVSNNHLREPPKSGWLPPALGLALPSVTGSVRTELGVRTLHTRIMPG